MTLGRRNRLIRRVTVHDCSIHSKIAQIITDLPSMRRYASLGIMNSPDVVFSLGNMESRCMGTKIDRAARTTDFSTNGADAELHNLK